MLWVNSKYSSRGYVSKHCNRYASDGWALINIDNLLLVCPPSPHTARTPARYIKTFYIFLQYMSLSLFKIIYEDEL